MIGPNRDKNRPPPTPEEPLPPPPSIDEPPDARKPPKHDPLGPPEQPSPEPRVEPVGHRCVAEAHDRNASNASVSNDGRSLAPLLLPTADHSRRAHRRGDGEGRRHARNQQADVQYRLHEYSDARHSDVEVVRNASAYLAE